MKRLMVVIAVFFTMFFVAPAWSHHPAEGIVSDDIWQMVDDLLTEADSPHLNIDFDDVMDSMGVDMDPEGNLSLVTSIVVRTEYVDEYLEVIEEVITFTNRIPSAAGTTENRTAPALLIETVLIEPEDPNEENIWTEIIVYEPVGSGESQDGIDPRNPDSNMRG